MVGVLPIDLLVRTSEQLHERLAIADRFIRETLKCGQVIYEATTLEWLNKAEDDWHVAQRTYCARKLCRAAHWQYPT